MKNDILYRKKIRKKYLARAISDSNFAAQIQESIKEPNKHPFGQISEHVGSTILGHNADCSCLDLEMWSTGIFSPRASVLGPAQLFREDVKHKLLEENLLEMQISYEKLNAYMVRCIPPESGGTAGERDARPVPDPRAILRDPETLTTITPHDYRYVGDISSLITVNKAKKRTREEINRIFENNVDLIDYIKPIKITTPQNNLNINTILDGKKVSVDIKGYTLSQNES